MGANPWAPFDIPRAMCKPIDTNVILTPSDNQSAPYGGDTFVVMGANPWAPFDIPRAMC
jgi:hypothetical protein